MAVKKSSGASKSAPKAAEAPKAATKPKAAEAPKAAAAPATPKSAPKAAATKSPATKAAAPKKAAAAPVKITEKQAEFLKTIHGHGEGGYPHSKKAETKGIEALKEKKLIKKGAKNKESGHTHYHVTKAGEKHLGGSAGGSTPSAS